MHRARLCAPPLASIAWDTLNSPSSRSLTLTVIAGFTNSYEYPPYRHPDLTIAILDNDGVGVYRRHEAILSLGKLLPRHSRIRDLSISFHSPDPHWGDVGHDGRVLSPTPISHHSGRFFGFHCNEHVHSPHTSCRRRACTDRILALVI